MQRHGRERFRALHAREGGFLIPNPFDLGPARILESLGFEALATTSSGFAATLGKLDGQVTREEAVEHARVLAAATTLPVSADLENGFADAPEGVAQTVTLADATGLAGCSIEDCARDAKTIYERPLAVERVRAAVEAAGRSEVPLVVTARCENHIRGNPDLADTIARLQAYQEAGADVLYAPGVVELADVRTLTAAVDRPLNVLLRPGSPSPRELFAAGARRISVGGALSLVANASVLEAAKEMLEQGSFERIERALALAADVRRALR